jgi:hypothetical protein
MFIKVLLILTTLFFVVYSNRPLVNWGPLEQAFFEAKEIGILIDYSRCIGTKPCALCTGIPLFSLNAFRTNAMSLTSGININHFQEATSIPEFVQQGWTKDTVTQIVLGPQRNQTPWTIISLIQVYSLEGSLVSYYYNCVGGEGIHIFI